MKVLLLGWQKSKAYDDDYYNYLCIIQATDFSATSHNLFLGTCFPIFWMIGLKVSCILNLNLFILCCYKEIYTHWVIMSRVFTNGLGDWGSIPLQVIPKTLKMVLDASLLNTRHYKVKIKGKEEQSREWSSAFSYTSV